ncbi:MFS transporter [Actinomycetospora sp. NBRC 106378]|uniref:MFS transporter n=1 Tax=Actinomycetospora sp. NBRC 106378 TaxID=3032208 RepID=UPI0024A2232F|nr:MFS transporter [Actinomycetospora sp. NBRC 106378]GLZ56087.1 MFS transporter [Actinomycetospora sp. NBRC 106378]
MTTAAPRRPAASLGTPLLVAAIVLVALNLRGPIVAVSPVVDAIRVDLGVSAAVAGLLTSLPVLAFALASPPASWLIGRIGAERAMLVGLAVLTAGTVLRSADGIAGALVGTAVIGAGITVGNIVIPVVIGRDFPHRSGLLLGVYTATMNVGSMITLSATVPIAAGTGWRLALCAWLVLAVAAAVVWTLATPYRRAQLLCREAPDESRPDDSSVAARAPWARPVGWLLLFAFAGQSFSYYGLTAWLPEILRDLRGLDATGAGVASSLFQILAVAGALVTPLVARRTSLRLAFVPVAAGFLALPGGLLLAPSLWPLWCSLAGAAQGGGFTVIFSACLAASRDTTENRRMAAFIQGGGYLLGALGPFLLGAVHEAVAPPAWDVPLAVVLGALVVLAVAGAAAVTRVRTQ